MVLVAALFALFFLPHRETGASLVSASGRTSPLASLEALLESRESPVATVSKASAAPPPGVLAVSGVLWRKTEQSDEADPAALRAARMIGFSAAEQGVLERHSLLLRMRKTLAAMGEDAMAVHAATPRSGMRRPLNKAHVQVALDLSSLGIETDMSSMRIPVKSHRMSVSTQHPARLMEREWATAEASTMVSAAAMYADAGASETTRRMVKPISVTQAKQYKLSRIKYGMLPVTGALSALFESGRNGIFAIGHDAQGGTSYGKFQISSRSGTMQRFIAFVSNRVPRWGEALDKAGPSNTGDAGGEMPSVWKQIGLENPLLFESLQDEFVFKTIYRPALQNILEATGVNLGLCSPAVREVLWSTAVHHGPYGAASLFSRTLKSLEYAEDDARFDRALIEAVYAERGSDFESSSSSVQAAVLSRLIREKNMACTLLEQEQPEQQTRLEQASPRETTDAT